MPGNAPDRTGCDGRLIEQRLGIDQVDGVEALGEPAADWRRARPLSAPLSERRVPHGGYVDPCQRERKMPTVQPIRKKSASEPALSEGNEQNAPMTAHAEYP